MLHDFWLYYAITFYCHYFKALLDRKELIINPKNLNNDIVYAGDLKL